MEIEFYLVSKSGFKRRLGKGEIKLFFGQTTKNMLPLAAKAALKPKAALLYAQAAAAFVRKDHCAVQRLKYLMFCELFGIEYDGFELVAAGQRMVFGKDDLQVYNVIIENQYDISPQNIAGKTVLDAGANTGVFSVFAAKLGAKKVYAFEPILENVECMRKNALANNVAEQIIPVPMGIGDKQLETEIEYSGSGDPSASLVLAHPPSSPLKKQKIKITTIDSFAQENNLAFDFIKMDIEGYEKEAIAGGARTIASCKPIMSFSAYHKPNDKIELPQALNSACPSYSCTLLSRSEEVFYCACQK